MSLTASSAELIDTDSLRASAREVFDTSKEERTALWTHFCGYGARLVFLTAHGLLVLSVSVALEHLDQVNWWLTFLPIWIGDALSFLLAVGSMFASFPYIKLCLVERSPRVNDNPSMLTEVLPEIVLAIPGLLLLLLAFCSEYSLCGYLASAQHGEPRSLPAATALLILVALWGSKLGRGSDIPTDALALSRRSLHAQLGFLAIIWSWFAGLCRLLRCNTWGRLCRWPGLRRATLRAGSSRASPCFCLEDAKIQARCGGGGTSTVVGGGTSLSVAPPGAAGCAACSSTGSPRRGGACGDHGWDRPLPLGYPTGTHLPLGGTSRAIGR
eukprot:TRINITY_DN27396_c0_g1_i2.p1 TRINITY_DN27396_c0_g1~~TRINITY_DN27396_c0_g1_i2.p1  ORF type:complete len:336 (+),score=41.64 TRINITY_DN27396_c0_g1_i2:28-1008(+)